MDQKTKESMIQNKNEPVALKPTKFVKVMGLSVIVRVITKSDDCAINHKNYKFREEKNSQVMKEREQFIKRVTKEA